MTFVSIYFLNVYINWWMFEEAWLDEFGEVDVGDRVFFVFLALMGPFSLPAAIMAYIGRRKSGERRIVRTRERVK